LEHVASRSSGRRCDPDPGQSARGRPAWRGSHRYAVFGGGFDRSLARAARPYTVVAIAVGPGLQTGPFRASRSKWRESRRLRCRRPAVLFFRFRSRRREADEEGRRARGAPVPPVAVGREDDSANTVTPAPRACRWMAVRGVGHPVRHARFLRRCVTGALVFGEDDREAFSGVAFSGSAERQPSDSPSSSGTSTRPREISNAPFSVLTIPRVRCGC